MQLLLWTLGLQNFFWVNRLKFDSGAWAPSRHIWCHDSFTIGRNVQWPLSWNFTVEIEYFEPKKFLAGLAKISVSGKCSIEFLNRRGRSCSWVLLQTRVPLTTWKSFKKYFLYRRKCFHSSQLWVGHLYAICMVPCQGLHIITPIFLL